MQQNALSLVTEELAAKIRQRREIEATLDELDRTHFAVLVEITTLERLRDKLGEPAAPDTPAAMPVAEITAAASTPDPAIATRPDATGEPADTQVRGRGYVAEKVLEFIEKNPGLRAIDIANRMVDDGIELSVKNPKSAIQGAASALLKARKLFRDSGNGLHVPGPEAVNHATAGSAFVSEAAVLRGQLDRVVTFLRVNGPADISSIAFSTHIPGTRVMEIVQAAQHVLDFQDPQVHLHACVK
jgi:hypothetical protein